MVPTRGRKLVRFFILFASVAVLSLGCLCLPASLLTTSTVTPPPPLPTETPYSIPTAPPTPNNPPPNNLGSAGPWLLLETDQGLYAVNADGSDPSQLTTTDYWNRQLQDAVQPNGSLVAFIAAGDPSANYLVLNLLSLPDGTARQVVRLSPPAYNVDLVTSHAIRDEKSLAWSPDGTRLAFIGAMEEPEADVYVYDTSDESITRISNDLQQDYAPFWSPDGKYVAYRGATVFGTEGGVDEAAMWFANADGTRYEKIFTGMEGWNIYGWWNDTTIVIDSLDFDCGRANLRLYDVVSRVQTVLQQGCFDSAAVSSWSRAVLFSDASGIYLATVDHPAPVQVSQEPDAYIDPVGSDERIFTVHFQNGLLATYGPSEMDHQASPMTSPSPPDSVSLSDQDVAEYGAIWAFTSRDPSEPGMWITGPGLQFPKLYGRAAAFPTWDGHNNLLFFAALDYGGFDLYRATFDAYYNDLALVSPIEADILTIAWLGDKYGD